MNRTWILAGVSLSLMLSLYPSAEADPCGMVPPIRIQDNVTNNITRTGDQLTFVSFKDGIEDIIINPAFKGKISEFGMLVPLPSPPAIRKVSDDIFQQIAYAVDPPKIQVNLQAMNLRWRSSVLAMYAREDMEESRLSYNTVRVLKEEAVGMFQAATLEAGSAEALAKWMTANQYVYPKGMDEAVTHYVKERWCFVAIKARVGTVKEAGPKPGMNNADNPLPPDAEFSGALHATGFRFRSDRCVVPMRMGTYNEGRLFNRLYYLSDSPSYIEQLPREMVKKQISGAKLVENLTGPLAIEVIGGTLEDLPKSYGAEWEKALGVNRDPAPYNAKAKEMFLSDLLAAKKGSLSHTFEEEEKELHLVAERMGLKGAAIDEFVYQAIGGQRSKEIAAMIEELKKMTLTIVEGDFPREVLRADDLTFATFEMPVKKGGFEVAPAFLLLVLASLVASWILHRRMRLHRLAA